MRPSMKVLIREHITLKGIARVLKLDAKLIADGKPVSPKVLEDIVSYVCTYPNKIHHPKEEQYLFSAMYQRSSACHELLDHLAQQHQREYQLIEDFKQALAAFIANPEQQRASFSDLAMEYAEFILEHIETENTQAFPMAEEILTEADWQTIDSAFSDNQDPLSTESEKQQFKELHRRITESGLPPFNLIATKAY